MEITLDGKISLVTGGASGIGRGIAKEFASAGSKVVIADLDEELAAGVAGEMEESGLDVVARQIDVTDEKSVGNVFEFIDKEFGRLDVLVNSAGTGCMSAIDELIIEEWDMVMDVNLKGTFLCTREASKIMKKQGSGRIINLSSINEAVPLAGEVPYCASKGGVMMLTRASALELAPYGINVNALGPGAIDTPLMEEMLSVPEIKDGISRQIPFGRLGKPEDVAKAALFLASELSEWVTGHTLYVDGGMHLVGEISYLWPVERVMGNEVPDVPICQPPKEPRE
ncbi:MAG: SDR family NAD(P)-dependent oxidoreductase [Actinomycetota bacterium]|nr:SDR family NAD(P)-dependent oxidoreductase [Actinomycetota bacterium]